MSKKELAKKRAADAKRAELIAQGILKPEDAEQEEDAPKTSMIKKDKKKKKP